MAAKKNYPPKFVKVGYVKYRMNGISKALANKRQIAGEADFTRHCVNYDISQTRSELVNTILHEIIHLVCHNFGLKDLKTRKEERIVGSLADGLTTVFLDNKNLLSWIVRVLEEERRSI